MSTNYVNTTSVSHYETYDHDTDFGGESNTDAIEPVSMQVKLVKQNNEVRMYIGSLFGESKASKPIHMRSPLPERFWPSVLVVRPLAVVGDGTTQIGCITIGLDGKVTIYSDLDTSDFTGESGNCGFLSTCVSWIV